VTERDLFDTRPDPDQLLARIGTDAPASATTGRGRLRVYIGMAPGVGKTYRMLEEGHRRAERGTDVVVGFVETHGRPRTAALIEGLEIVPRRRLEYRGVVVEELDTDAVIARRPTVALIDELAHSNAPGSPRDKRWEDVDLIRDAGIHVISTCNVQHLESVADVVGTITGAPVRERIPDSVLDAADELELVDMSPHALRQRMRHGNVYPPDRIGVALERFFTEANQTALREIALRRVARSVDEELEDQGPVPAAGASGVSERVLVLIDGGSADRSAVRRAASLAGALHAPLLALRTDDVDSPATKPSGQDVAEALAYAEDLGAEIVRAAGPTLAAAIADACLRRRVTHLILPYQPSRRLLERLRPSLADEVLQRVPGIEVHLVTAPDRGPGPHPSRA
jgi:two-component system sensor histidine kinase KdpD